MTQNKKDGQVDEITKTLGSKKDESSHTSIL